MAEQGIKQEIMHQRTILAALSFPEKLLFRNFPLFHISNFPVNRIGRRIPGIGIEHGSQAVPQQLLRHRGYQHFSISSISSQPFFKKASYSARFPHIMDIAKMLRRKSRQLVKIVIHKEKTPADILIIPAGENALEPRHLFL